MLLYRKNKTNVWTKQDVYFLLLSFVEKKKITYIWVLLQEKGGGLKREVFYYFSLSFFFYICLIRNFIHWVIQNIINDQTSIIIHKDNQYFSHFYSFTWRTVIVFSFQLFATIVFLFLLPYQFQNIILGQLAK